MARRRGSRTLLARGLPTLIGWLVIAVGIDWGLGAAVNAVIGDDEPRPQRVEVTVEGQIPLDPRADSPAMAPYPWAEAYFAELAAVQYDYAPYLLGRLGDNEGEYINTTADGRRSYLPEAAREGDVVDIWFLGGSTMFGEGQRDDYTIPSSVARLAEADGIAVRAHNLAHQGLVSWQELLIFERELARRPSPDAVVFYDGTNDFNALLEHPGVDPVHYDEEQYGAMFDDSGLPIPEDAIPAEPTAWQSYEETSVTHKVLRSVFGIEAAGAAGSADDGLEATEAGPIVDEALDIYLRAVDLSTYLAGLHGITPFFFWQPVDLEPGPYDDLAESLPDPVIDLSRVLDDPPRPVFIDGGHTNELGAELVAEAIYDHLQPLLAAAAP